MTAQLLDLDDRALGHRTLYRVGDILWHHREAIQAALFQKERNLLDIPGSIVFYDLSNAFYHGRHNAGLMRFGRSRQKCSDLPLVSLALALDDAGEVRLYMVSEGKKATEDSIPAMKRGRFTDARLFIAVLAYHAVHLIRTRLAASGIHLCWSSVRTRMAPWVRVTTRLREIAG